MPAYDADPEYAEPLYMESIELNRQIRGNSHPKTAFAIDNLALFYDFVLDDLDRAEPLYREAMAMLIEVYGDEHPEVAQTMGNVGGFLARRVMDSDEFDQAAYDEADGLMSRSVAMDRRWRGDHPYLGHNLVRLAELRNFADRGVEAEPLSREALVVYAKTLPEDHPFFAWARAALGRSLLAQERHAEAERELLQAREVLQEEEEEWDDVRADVLADLADTYEALEQPGAAERYRAELAALNATLENDS